MPHDASRHAPPGYPPPASEQAPSEDEEDESPAPARQERAGLGESPLDREDGDVAFSESLPPEIARFGEPSPVEPCCEWCNARLSQPDAARCGSCGALLQPLNGESDVPGLTTISSAARAAAERAERQRAAAGASVGEAAAAIARPSSRDVYEPPNEEVLAAMREIEREAARADPLREVEPGPLAAGEQEEQG